MDFTIKTLPKLYKALQSQGFSFISVTDILQNKEIFSKYVILRHDVEKYYENALEFARIQNELGIRGVYYFRISEKFFKADIVRQIVSLGHEVGYHYDDLTQCNGNYNVAIKRFEKNLNMLREIAPVKTICMDGSPLSKYDNRNLWRGIGEEMRDEIREMRDEKLTAHHSSLIPHHYRDYGIIGEPYFDIDFSEVLYLTDTGRMWDGGKVSVRDKVGSREYGVSSREYGVGSKKSREFGVSASLRYGVRSKERIGEKEKVRKGEGASERKGEREKKDYSPLNLKYRFHSTNDIIKAAEEGCLPDKIMMTFHPQRWHYKPRPWVKELVWQNIKNVIKRYFFVRKQ